MGTISEMNVEYEENCRYDSLSFYDGRPQDCGSEDHPGRHCFSLCGTRGRGPVVSSTNIFTLVFRSDANYNRTGFSIAYTIADADAATSSGDGEEESCRGDNELKGMASIWKGEEFVCSGGIISDQWIVLPARCVSDSDGSYTAVYGIKGPTSKPLKRHPITQSRIHPDYDTHTGVNNIALVQLADKVTFDESVGPFCLSQNRTDEGNYLKLVGATETAINADLVADLRGLMLPVLEMGDCDESNTHYRSDAVCAGYPAGGIDTCIGDPGSLLISSDDNRNYLVAMNDLHETCSAPGSPALYTDLSFYYTWIMDTIQ